MTENEVYKRLQPLFEEIFDLEFIKLTPSVTASDVDEWDSLNHIRLIVAVETEFEISLNAGEAGELENVGQFVQMVMDKVSL
jgi:acyl carrier protein